VENEEIIDYAAELHAELVERENITVLQEYKDTFIHFEYRLKNGKKLSRRYSVNEDKFCEAMNRLYEERDYKLATLDIFDDKIGRLESVEINHASREVREEEEIAELIACLQADYLEMSYTETRNHQAWNTNIWVNYIPADEMDEDVRGMHQFHCSVNANFKNTIAWMREHNFLDGTFNPSNYDLAVVSAEQWNEYGTSEKERLEYAAGNSYGKVTVEAVRNPMINELKGVRRISDAETKQKLREFIQTTPVDYVSGKDYAYYVVTVEPTSNYVNIAAAFYEDAKGIEQFMK